MSKEKTKAKLDFLRTTLLLKVRYDTTLTSEQKAEFLTRKFDVRKLKDFNIDTVTEQMKFSDAIRCIENDDFYQPIQEKFTWTLSDGDSQNHKLITINDGTGRVAEANFTKMKNHYGNSYIGWKLTNIFPGMSTGIGGFGSRCNVQNLKDYVAKHNDYVPIHTKSEFTYHSTSAAAVAICARDVDYLTECAKYEIDFNAVIGHGYGQPYNAVMMASDPGSHLSVYHDSFLARCDAATQARYKALEADKYNMKLPGEQRAEITAEMDAIRKVAREQISSDGVPTLDATLAFLAEQGVDFDYKGPGLNGGYYGNNALFLDKVGYDLKEYVAQSLIKHGANPFIGGSSYVASHNIVALKAVLESADEALIARIEAQFVETMSAKCAYTYSGNAARTIAYLERLTGRYDESREDGSQPFKGGVAGTHLAKMANALLDSGILVDEVVSREALVKVLDLGSEVVDVATAEAGEGVGADDDHVASGAGGGIGLDGEYHIAGAHTGAETVAVDLTGADASAFAADVDHV